MIFLQPWMLAALPIIALPIIIHLINQRRFQTIRWAAMMFLLAANRMSRGYARIRQWLILAARTLALAGLIIAVSRPLASGWLGLAAGGQADTTIVLLDRSPSMRQVGQGAMSKLDSGRQQLTRSLGMLNSGRWLLIDSANNRPIELESPKALETLPETEPVSASADLPALLQTTYEYIQANKPTRTEIWICSDLRSNDWNADSGRWQTLRESFLEMSRGVRFHLLAYPDAAAGNRSIRVTGVRRLESSAGAEILLSLRITQAAAPEGTVTVPVQLEIGGARSEISVELQGGEGELKDHAIPIERSQTRGWGRVSIPADANPSDDEFYFVFDQPTPRKTLIVADDPAAVRPLVLASSISPDPTISCTAEVLAPDQLAGVAWEDVSLLMWQAPLPTDEAAKSVTAFLNRGGQGVFFPPPGPTPDEFAGFAWEDWKQFPQEEGLPISTWMGDQDLLAHAQSGTALPVGQLKVTKACGMTGEGTPLAALQDGARLLVRSTSQRNAVFCATTTQIADSSLARDGVVLYVMIQRALASGASVLDNTRQLVAGEVPSSATGDWTRIGGEGEVLSTAFSVQAGVYQAGEKLFAVNRSEAEDRPAVVTDARLAPLFQGLDFDRVDDQAGSRSSLIEEIWRLFLAFMMAALVIEAALCIPRLPQPGTASAPKPREQKAAA